VAPAASDGAAQVVVTEVPTLDAAPSLGPGIIEYALTSNQWSGGYYTHSSIQAANLPSLGYDDWLDTFLHELGHVSGLAHVDSPTEIMRPVVGAPQSTYGSGDVAGLASEGPR